MRSSTRSIYSRFTVSAAWTLLLLICGPGATGAYLEGETESEEPPPSLHPLPPRLPPPLPPRPGGVDRFLAKVLVLEPYRAMGLCVFPVALASPEDWRSYETLRGGLAKGTVRLTEGGSVNRVLVSNRSTRYLFLLGGEAVRGGKQNRMFREDVLLWPRSGPTAVPVYCIERGRWQGSAGFDPTSMMPGFGLRTKALRGASQESVWQAVRSSVDALSIDSPTDDYTRLLAAPAVASGVGEITRTLGSRFPHEAVGLVAVGRHGLIGCDLFGSAELFARLRQQVLESYAIETVCRPGRYGDWATAAQVRRFLESLRRCALRPCPTTGAGRRLALDGAGAAGAAVLLDGAVVHLSGAPSGRHWLP